MATPPYGLIADSLKAGDVVPFFGAAASAVYRPKGEAWEPGKPFMPFGGELAKLLATKARYPDTDKHRAFMAEALRTLRRTAGARAASQAWPALKPLLQKRAAGPPDLSLVASYVEYVVANRRSMDQQLRELFSVECPPGNLHHALASVAQTQLYVTTNYDRLLEVALAPRTPHVIVDRAKRGLWVGVAGGPLVKIDRPEELYTLLNDPDTDTPTHPVVFKMHGSISMDKSPDSYLITEEDYVDFLSREMQNYIPPYVSGLMQGKNLLFLGYSLADWNVRVILRQLLTRPLVDPVRFWAIVRGHSDVEQELWRAHKLNIFPVDLRDFADQLQDRL